MRPPSLRSDQLEAWVLSLRPAVILVLAGALSCAAQRDVVPEPVEVVGGFAIDRRPRPVQVGREHNMILSECI